MANVLHKTADPADYRQSVDTSQFPPADWLINPDVSQVIGVPSKYWARPLTDPVTEMDQAAKDAVDIAAAAVITMGNRVFVTDETTAVEGEGVRVRALIELFNKRDNYLVNRIAELQAALDAMKASSGNTQALRDAIPGAWLATNTRSKANAVADYTADIDAGNQDT